VVEVDAVLSLYVGTGIRERLGCKTLFTTQLVGLLLDEKLVGGDVMLLLLWGVVVSALLFRESAARSRCYARTRRAVPIERN
jgi:hypothetical protein